MSNISTGAVPHQKWHGDGGHLFPQENIHHPAYMINVFIPLVDLTTTNGPTEFAPGTHFIDRFERDQVKFPILGQAGDAILFDYRVKHRGLANVSGKDRLVLYMGFSRPFYRDHANNRSCIPLMPHSKPWQSRVLRGEHVPLQLSEEMDRINPEPPTPEAVAAAAGGVEGSQHAEEGPEPVSKRQRMASLGAVVEEEAGTGEEWVMFHMTLELGEEEHEIQAWSACPLHSFVCAVWSCCQQRVNPRSPCDQVRHGELPMEIATQFALKNNLDASIVAPLAAAIEQQSALVRANAT